MTIRIEAKAVDGSRVGGDAEVAWLIVSWLWLRSNRSDFNNTEAEIKETINGFRLLVEACCKADWVDECLTKELREQGRSSVSQLRASGKGHSSDAHLCL